MRQEPKLSDLDHLDPTPKRRAQDDAPVVVRKAGAGGFAWMLILLNLIGLGALGFMNLQLQGQAQSQGRTSNAGIESLNLRIQSLQDQMGRLDRVLAQQQTISSELGERVDLVGAKGVAENAAGIQRLEASTQTATQTLQTLSGRFDALVSELGQSTERGQDLGAQVRDLDAVIDRLETRLGGIDARLSGQDALIETVQVGTQQLPDLLAPVEAEVASLASRQQTQQSSVDGLQDQLAELRGRVAVLSETPAVDVSGLQSVEVAQQVNREEIQRLGRVLEDYNEQLRAIDAFRSQTNQAIFRLEEALRQAQ